MHVIWYNYKFAKSCGSQGNVGYERPLVMLVEFLRVLLGFLGLKYLLRGSTFWVDHIGYVNYVG